MLTHLSISNYAIIENIELNFQKGFTVITGETGAGKSILLGALSLILGKRADTTVLNDKSKKCIVEGEFVFDKNEFIDFFQDNDLDYENRNLIRREISSSGKSRAFVNDTPVGLSVLKELTERLIDIHSQHQTLQVKDAKFQINVIDAFANLNSEVEVYSKEYFEYLNNRKILSDLIEKSKNSKTDLDYIKYQVEEIEALSIQPNEKENIKKELDVINNAEEIKSVLEGASNSLLNTENNLLSELRSITNSFSKINNCGDEYTSIFERLNSLVIELEDLASEIDSQNNSFSYSQENLLYLNDRIGKIYAIEQKHNISSTEEIYKLLENLRQQLTDSNSYDAKIKELTELVNKQEGKLIEHAENLSAKRVENFEGLCSKIQNSLQLLGMGNAEFSVRHSIHNELTETGIDKVVFMFSSNKGVEQKELSKTASGGELSRLMLTIKAILATNQNLSTIIFDEIDSGVSGDIADKMAVIMKQMSGNMQVIAITHLPQVAAKGNVHFKIYKETIAGKTKTLIKELSKVDRVEELAIMLSGEKLTSAARENAKTLLKT